MRSTGTTHMHVIEADTAEEFKEKVFDLAKVLGGGQASSSTPPPAVAPEGSKSGKKTAKKESPPAEAEEANPFDDGKGAAENPFAEDAAAEEVKLTYDAVKEELTKVFNHSKEEGPAGLKAILESVGQTKVSGIKEADYPKVMAACAKFLKKK